jgi:hypothetical protein
MGRLRAENSELRAACKAMYLACGTDAVRRVLGADYEVAFGLARTALAKARGEAVGR